MPYSYNCTDQGYMKTKKVLWADLRDQARIGATALPIHAADWGGWPEKNFWRCLDPQSWHSTWAMVPTKLRTPKFHQYSLAWWFRQFRGFPFLQRQLVGWNPLPVHWVGLTFAFCGWSSHVLWFNPYFSQPSGSDLSKTPAAARTARLRIVTAFSIAKKPKEPRKKG